MDDFQILTSALPKAIQKLLDEDLQKAVGEKRKGGREPFQFRCAHAHTHTHMR